MCECVSSSNEMGDFLPLEDCACIYIYIYIYVCVCVCEREREREWCSLSLILFVVALVYSNEYFFTCVSNDAIPFLHSYVSSYLAHVSLTHTQNTLLLVFE